MKYISTCGSIKNTKIYDKPNEDYVLCDDKRNIYILLDGVSRDKINGKYPSPSPAREVSKLFAKEVYDYLKKNNEQYGLELIKEAFIKGNNAIEHYNIKYDYSDFLPGTVGIVCVIENDRLYYGYIGDCYGRIIQIHKIKMFTKCQTEQIAIHKKEFSSKTIRNEICNNVKNPYGYGVLTGQKDALDFLVLGEFNLDNVDMVFLSSDGMEPFLGRLVRKDYVERDAEYYLKKSVKSREEDDKAVIIIYKKLSLVK